MVAWRPMLVAACASRLRLQGAPLHASWQPRSRVVLVLGMVVSPETSMGIRSQRPMEGGGGGGRGQGRG